MGFLSRWFQPNDQPKTGGGTNHPRLPGTKPTVTFRTADGKKVAKPAKGKGQGKGRK